MGSEGYHEPYELMTARTRDMHRAITSLMEELEAVDWYQQRVDVTEDADLRAILAHNRDEEKEHAAMVLEWIRRQDGVIDKNLKAFLFTSGSITQRESAAAGGSEAVAFDPSGRTATVGSLKGHNA